MALRVLVTAGASGIGAAIVRRFAKSGASVFTCDVDQEQLGGILADLPNVEGAICDVADRSAVDGLVEKAVHTIGGLDVVINNAGIAGPTGPMWTIEPDDWERVFAVNLTGAYNVCRRAIPHLIASGGGSVINMSAAAGRMGYRNRSAYSASKWGMIGLTKSLAMELGEHGIRVNAILPGAVAGPRLDKVIEGRATITGTSRDLQVEQILANQSLKALVDPQDVAEMALFLASSAAKSISGQALPIDGDMQRA